MTIKNFIIEIQEIIASASENVSNFEVEIELDHTLHPNKIHYSIDYIEKTVTITKGNCGF